jgi:hypothetical protein
MISVSPSGQCSSRFGTPSLQPNKRKAWDLNPHPREGARFSKPARPTLSDYLPNEIVDASEGDGGSCRQAVLDLRNSVATTTSVPFALQWTAGESNPDCLGANQASSHWTSGPYRTNNDSIHPSAIHRVTGVGLEPTGTRLSTSPLCQFAYPAADNLASQSLGNPCMSYERSVGW